MNKTVLSFQDYKKINYNREQNGRLMKLIENIPDSNGSRYFNKIDLKIAIVTDEFMYNYYKDCANLIYLNYYKCKRILENNKVDMFLFVTCWRGMEDNDWRGKRRQEKGITKIIELCNSKNIPTIFQSIEDPSNYNVFIELAKKFDYIFTTDKDKIDRYKTDCSNQNVYLSMYGVNPIFHNPIGIKNNEKIQDVLFSGSWMKKYPDRCTDMEKIFKGVLNSGKTINIIDRNFERDEESYFYPKEYISYTSPSVNHNDLQKIHKLYNWIININSIKYSSTMCSMRCYEAQALGNLIISNYSIAVNNHNPSIFIANNIREVKQILNSYSEEGIYKQQIYNIRNVMSNQCSFNRIVDMIMKIDVNFKMDLNKSVLVVSQKITPIIQSMFDNQVIQNKHLIEANKVKEIYNDYDFITFFKEDYLYEEYYLQDMMNGFKYTDSDYITKDSYYCNRKLVNGIEHNYINTIKDKYKTMFDTKTFSIEFLLELNHPINRSKGYSIDHFELNTKNNTKETENKNIFLVMKNKYMDSINNRSKKSKIYKFSIIVPIYNNGKYLLNKCFNSLKRSSMFNEMEIILVDDGSEDKDTLAIIERIGRENKNVVIYKFEGNASGSASRPRNKGLEISTADLVTFLDPDNEAINDGYTKLYKEINNSDLDMVIGSVLKVSNKETLMKYSNKQVIDNPSKYEIDNNFKVNSIQGTMIRKDLIKQNNLTMVNGALGQDTLFFIELMLNAKKVKIIDESIHVYYASVSTSQTNNINKSFFEKSLILEKEMCKRLEKYEVKEIYISKKLEYFYRHWYMNKMKISNRDDIVDIVKIMKEILQVYDYTEIKDIYIKDFIEYANLNKYDEIEKNYLS